MFRRTTRPSGHHRTALTSIGLLACAVALSACSASGGGEAKEAADPELVSTVQSDLEASLAEPTFELGDDAAFDAQAASGKNVWVIDIASSIEIVQVSDAATKEALGLVGSELTTFDGKGDPSEFARGIQAAIDDKADAIVLYAIDPNVVEGPLQKAKAAGIPVIVAQYGDPDRELPDSITAQVTYSYSAAGAMEANAVAAQANGEPVGVEMISSSDVSNSADILKGFKDTLEKSCPNCTLYVDDVPVADWQTKISTQVNSTLNAHRDIKFVVPVYDGMATFAIPGIKAAGRSDVSVISFNASKSIMEYLADGDTVTGDVGSPQAWFGYGVADQVMRVLAGEEPLQDEKIGLRLFTADNIDSIDLDAPESDWYGVDFRSSYKALWGLS
jgi:ribose transport system substrate-binding protein